MIMGTLAAEILRRDIVTRPTTKPRVTAVAHIFTRDCGGCTVRRYKVREKIPVLYIDASLPG